MEIYDKWNCAELVLAEGKLDEEDVETRIFNFIC